MKHFAATVTYNKPVGPALNVLELGHCTPLNDARPGQFVMFRPDHWHADPLLPRPLSLLSVGNGKAGFLIQDVGRGSHDMVGLRIGQTVSIIGPAGSALPVPQPDRQVILVAGGVGLAPLLMWLEHFCPSSASSKARSKTRPVLLYGARTADNLVLLDRLSATAARVLTATEDGSHGEKGRVTDLLEPLLRESAAGGGVSSGHASARPDLVVMACGPPAMMAAAARMCTAASVRCVVSLENRMACGRGLCLGCALQTPKGAVFLVCREGPVMDATEVNWEGY